MIMSKKYFSEMLQNFVKMSFQSSITIVLINSFFNLKCCFKNKEFKQTIHLFASESKIFKKIYYYMQ